ncbi:MAG TPA: hypothetical protein VK015_00920, partial [Microbacterium sp.]|nr:hypothetical protein [Microbacterium sp.]
RQAIDADYEALIADALRRAAAAGAPQAGLLGVLARTYIEHSLGDGAVYDTVTAALAAAAPADDRPLALSDSQLALARDLFAQSAERGPVAIVMFLGAADALVDAVRDGLVEREDAIAHLVDLFLPLLPDGDAT